MCIQHGGVALWPWGFKRVEFDGRDACCCHGLMGRDLCNSTNPHNIEGRSNIPEKTSDFQNVNFGHAKSKDKFWLSLFQNHKTYATRNKLLESNGNLYKPTKKYPLKVHFIGIF